MSGRLDRDGFELGYRIEGAGTNALVIGSSVYYPRTFSRNLREHLRLVFVDHRGFVPMPADVPPRAFELDTILEDTEHLRSSLELGAVVVIGHSGHAFMALEYAKRFPQHVSHVVLIGCSPRLGPEAFAAADRYWEESVDPVRKAVMAENLARLPDSAFEGRPFSEFFVPFYLRNAPRFWFDPRFDASELWEGVVPNAIMGKIWGEDFARIDIATGLSALQAPVFLALGRYDFSVAPPSSWDPFRDRFRELTLRVFERSGHTPPYEEPALFDAELLSWLASRTP
ncbi:MAG: alpha/beta fold hydrolase [Pseudomonadales bacterium]